MDIIGSTTNLLSTASSLGSNFGSVAGNLNIPAPNILSNYASYTYVLGLHALTSSDLNFPDQSYKNGKVLPAICKSAGAEPDNRIQTAFGKHDFYINNLQFDSLIGYQSVQTTNVSTVQFDVFEPYSVGLFILALQQAAANAKHGNWRDAPFLLSIEFRGNTENGQMKKVPFSTRHIPLRFTTISMKSTEQGTRYLINAFAVNGLAQTTEFASLRTDTTIQGKTVQEVLQTGPQSLQAVVNAKLYESVKKEDVAVADKIVILFPKTEEMASSLVPSASGVNASRNNKATLNPQKAADSGTVLKKIGVDESTLQQSVSSVNEIGSSSMGFSVARKGDIPPGNKTDTWDPISRTWLRGMLVPDPTTSSYKFSQNCDITTAINQILLTSEYANKALSGKADKNGMITWWRIDTQIYYVESDQNTSKTNKKPKIAVYRVVPYQVHPGKTAGPNINPDYDALKKQVIKRYDYIFTGKNTEILNFDIDFSTGFANSFAADSYTNNDGVTQAAKQSDGAAGTKKPTVDASPAGATPSPASINAGAMPSGQQNNAATKNPNDGPGGVAGDGLAQRIAKDFHAAITNPFDMVNLNLEILGDPYWIVNSGVGNYVSKAYPGANNLNMDGSVNWQASQVDLILNFRSPIDINQTTGLYNFKGANNQDMTKDPKAGPALGFTGLYVINIVTSEFRHGSFTQKLQGFRRGGQELKDKGNASNRLNPATPGAASGSAP